jgi:hypothetical protein
MPTAEIRDRQNMSAIDDAWPMILNLSGVLACGFRAGREFELIVSWGLLSNLLLRAIPAFLLSLWLERAAHNRSQFRNRPITVAG